MKRAIIAALIGGWLTLAPVAFGYTTSHRVVLGHAVRIVRWRPGGRVSAFVDYSAARAIVPAWAGARRRTSVIAAINGGTWTWTTGRPTGTVYSRGRRITPVADNPAVGFYSTGGIVFGAAAAREHGAANIVAGTAYLVVGGVVQHTYPYASGGQVTCGPKGTDGYGCFRSNIVRWRNGDVGLVEIAYAPMLTAARVLHHIGVTDALTLDSGGSAQLWTRDGARNCAGALWARGHCDGITEAAGLPWERPVVDAVIVRQRKA